MTDHGRLIAGAFVALGLMVAWTQQGVRAAEVDGHGPPAAAFNPVDEIYQINEARRQSLITQQLDLNYRMNMSAGYGPRYPNPFEPWPRVPGDIWGFPLPRPVAQPIGHLSVQTGPNRWTYRPLYAAAAMPPTTIAGTITTTPVDLPAPPGRVQLPGPSDRDEPAAPNLRPAPGRRTTGPREF